MWDPQQYEIYANHRGRPFDDLVRRIGARAPARVIDL
ncbi:MAG TPA: trans-aconitate 2-methyltransferase, partial [Mycobacteriales bacterium]